MHGGKRMEGWRIRLFGIVLTRDFGMGGGGVQLASELQVLMIKTLNEGIDNVWGSVGRRKE